MQKHLTNLIKNTFILADYRGNSCNNEKHYNKDYCVNKAIEKESLKQIGCTTPYAHDKNHICKNKEDSYAAYKLYNKNLPGATIFKTMAWKPSNITKECFNPCPIFTFMTRSFEKCKKGKNSYSNVLIYFEENIKVTEEYYVYTGINLIAEIGGYVGLFLGVSVNQVINLMNFIATKLKIITSIL